MVIRGNIRGNGAQLAQYLLGEGGNERVEILEVAGRSGAQADYLHQTLRAMSLTAELTKSQKGLYHAQINPAYSEDRRMSNADWSQAADILAHELGLSEQRRVIVLHTKKNRTHAHVVFERYDLETGKIIDHKFSRLAQDRARKEMERVFEQQPTPHRNKHRPELKETLTKLWQQTDTGPDFIRQVHAQGYLLAEGVPRHPFMVVDQEGRSFDLVRQLKGIRIKEVRQRLRDAKLIPEKEAIELMRQRQEGSSGAAPMQQSLDHTPDKAKRFAQFWQMGAELTQAGEEIQPEKRQREQATAFVQTVPEITASRVQPDEPEKETNNEASETDTKLTKMPEADRAKHRTTLQAFMQAEDELIKEEDVPDEQDELDKRDRQKRVAEQFAANQVEVIPSGTEPNNKRHQQTLREFMREGDLFTNANSSTDEARQRQQETATKFFDNQEMTTVSDENERQKLMQEQKNIRERNRQRKKRRIR